MVNKTEYNLFFVILFCFLCNSCVVKLFYKSPKPDKFSLYKNNNVGLKTNSLLKTNGFYYYVVTDKDFPGERYLRYYRFLSNGKLHIEGDLKGSDPVSAYVFIKYAIDDNIDKSLYGYYKASNNVVEMEYVKEERELLHKDYFFTSTGYLSDNGDTLFITEQINLNKKQTEKLNRVCLFYKFPN